MGEAIYRGYDLQGLDAQYDNRARVPNFQEFVDFYTSESARAREQLAGHVDVPYGPTAEETLDVFLPADGGRRAPVHVFFHGGYWRAFQAKDFDFVAFPLVAAGAVCVVVNYALMPGVTMGELLRQCRAGLAWVRDNIADHGGDPRQVYISGHSAGGHITAMMLADDPADVAKDIRGAVAISGIFDMEPIRLCYLNETLALGENDVRAYSPLQHLPAVRPALEVVYGEFETDEFARQAASYAEAVTAVGLSCRARPIAGVEHMGVVKAMADPDSEIVGLILGQMGLR